MTTIYVLRHGETLHNRMSRFAGRTEAMLTEKGVAQAKLAAEKFQIVPDIIYSSPLVRARVTATPFAERFGLEINVLADLVEMNGGKWEDIPFHSIKEYYPGFEKIWGEAYADVICPAGETTREVRSRAGMIFDKIAEANEGKTVLAVSHGCVIRSLPSYYAGCDDKIYNETEFATNLAITKIVYENGKGRIEFYSDDSYLGDMATKLTTV